MLRLPMPTCPPPLVRAAGALAVMAVLAASTQQTQATDAPMPPAAARAAAAPLAEKVITLDPGHNGGNASHTDQINRLVPAGGGRRKACDTTGTQTTDGRLTEYALNLDVAQRLRRLLTAQGARVVMTRTTSQGVGPCINERARIGNAARSDAAISIHGDGGPPGGRGFHVIRPKGVSGQSKSMLAASDLLGRRVRNALRAKGYRPSTYLGIGGLDLRNDLGGLNLSTVPKVFVELGNMRNPADGALMKRPAQRERMASALSRALAVFLRAR